MDNSEVNLYQMINVIWKKKKPILLFTALTAVASALISNVQPKYYETQKTAYILKPDHNIYKNLQTWPAEFYENYSKSPGILKAVLENLPKEVQFEENIAPMSYLKTILRVQSQFISANGILTAPAIKLTYFARHPDPSSAHKIVNTWQNIIESNFPKHNDKVNFGDFSEKEEQLKRKRNKWGEDKKKLADFNESYNIANKTRKLQSIQRLLVTARVNFETKMNQMDPTKIHDAKIAKIKILKSQKLSLKERYQLEEETLKEHKRQLNLEPKLIKLTRNTTNGLTGISELQVSTTRNPIYTSLQQKIITGEVNLKSLQIQKDHKGQKILRLQSEISNPSLAGNISDIAQNNNQIKLLAKTIKSYETEARNLEKQLSERRIEHRTLTRKEQTSAANFTAELKNFKELELLKTSKSRGPDFSLSTVEPAKFFGPSVRTNTLLASAGGLIFMIFFTLIKDAFSPQRADAINSKPMDAHQYANRSNDDLIQNEGLVIKSALIVPPPKNSEPLKQPQPEYSPVFK